MWFWLAAEGRSGPWCRLGRMLSISSGHGCAMPGWLCCGGCGLRDRLSCRRPSGVNLALLAMRPLLPPGTRLIIREANTPLLALRRGRVPAPALMRCAYRLLYPTADLVLCQHQAMAEEMRTRFGVPVEKIAVLPNPVDSAWLRAGSPRREPGPGRRFVAAGRLTHQKGFDRLIDMVADGGPGDRLCIFGDGPDRAALEGRVRERGAADRIRGGGARDHLPRHRQCRPSHRRRGTVRRCRSRHRIDGCEPHGRRHRRCRRPAGTSPASSAR